MFLVLSLHERQRLVHVRTTAHEARQHTSFFVLDVERERLAEVTFTPGARLDDFRHIQIGTPAQLDGRPAEPPNARMTREQQVDQFDVLSARASTDTNKHAHLPDCI
jgi:hypothetical protein